MKTIDDDFNQRASAAILDLLTAIDVLHKEIEVLQSQVKELQQIHEIESK